MEAINNIAGAASKAIWGEGPNNTEPVSGERGAGTLNEPYDKGNEESREPVTTSTTKETTGTTTSTTKDPIDTTSTTSETSSDNSTTLKDQSTTNKSKTSDIPVPHTDEEREEAMKTGKFPRDPNDHSGEPLHIHDGSEGAKTERRKSVGQEGGQPHGKGTGEQYVKSTGLQAEGGDFDAANPGAGQEATRLLEEHGVHRDTDSKDSHSKTGTKEKSPSPSSSSNPGKVSKMDKIKEKLHLKK